MLKILLAVIVGLMISSTAVADTNDPMATVRRYADSFNQGDVKAMAATCADQASILDGLPPHAWTGPTACQDWYRDVMAAGEHEGATGWRVILHKPRHIEIRGDRAYVVVPASMTFMLHGKPVTQKGSVWTLALRKQDDGWRITAWAWAKGGN